MTLSNRARQNTLRLLQAHLNAASLAHVRWPPRRVGCVRTCAPPARHHGGVPLNHVALTVADRAYFSSGLHRLEGSEPVV